VKTGAEPDIRIALVGLGHVADHQLAAIEMTEGLRLVAACDKKPDAARRLSEGISFYPCIEDLLATDQFDIVMISTPNREHFHLGGLVIEAGKDLILEKPAVETRQQLDNIIRKSECADIFLYFALHAAFGVEVVWLRQQLTDDNLNLGNLRCFRSRFYDPYQTEHGLLKGAESLGGSWMDSGINALSVLGNFVEAADLRLESSHMRDPAGLNCSETEGMVSMLCDRVRGLVHTSWLTDRNHKSTLLIFDEDEVLLDHSYQRASIGKNANRRTLFTYNGSLHRLTNHYVGVFSDLVARYSARRSNLEFAVALHKVLFDADENRQSLVDSVATGAGVVTEK